MFGLSLASLFRGLYFARDWQALANQQLYPILAALLTAGRAHGFTDPYVLPQTPVAVPPATSSNLPANYPVEAITGADGVASNGVPLQKTFDDIVETTKNHAPTCMSPVYVTPQGLWLTEDSSSWRSLERFVSDAPSSHSPVRPLI